MLGGRKICHVTENIYQKEDRNRFRHRKTDGQHLFAQIKILVLVTLNTGYTGFGSKHQVRVSICQICLTMGKKMSCVFVLYHALGPKPAYPKTLHAEHWQFTHPKPQTGNSEINHRTTLGT